MAGWSKNTHAVQDRGLGGGKRTRSIEGAVLHHVAGTDGLSYVANRNNRNSHPTYHVSNSGRVTGIVHPDRRPFSTAHSVDNVAITFEIDNQRAGGNWPISDAAMESVLVTILDHARQCGYTRFVKNTPGKDQTGVFFIAWHSQYQATACPGPYITGKLDWIIAELNRRIKGGAKPSTGSATKPATKPKTYEATAFGIGTTATKAQWKTIQSWLRKLGRYNGPADGVPGVNTWKGIQLTAQRYGYYDGPVDGVPGRNTARGMQQYAANGGGYTGPIDGILGPNSWAGFVKRLSS